MLDDTCWTYPLSHFDEPGRLKQNTQIIAWKPAEATIQHTLQFIVSKSNEEALQNRDISSMSSLHVPKR